MNHLILHIRLTTKCNADCSYCSSYSEKNTIMSFEEFKKSIDWIVRKIDELRLGADRKNCTIQYVGGEILTLPLSYIKLCVEYARKTISPLFFSFEDGLQTNLIGSNNKIKELINLFAPNKISTSVDNFTKLRTIGGDNKKYIKVFEKNWKDLKKDFVNYIPAILVIDENNLEFVEQEILLANEKVYNITLRPVFSGGSIINQTNKDKLSDLYVKLFKKWVFEQKIIIQPFFQLLLQRVGEIHPKYENLGIYNQGCPFQKNCAKSSLDLEPNGDIYICLDMADSKQLKLGNSLSDEFNYELWEKISNRADNLSDSCYSCDYFGSCQGGCASEALHHQNDLYGKTEYCSVWKSLFKEIDIFILSNDIEKIIKWIRFIEKRATPIYI